MSLTILVVEDEEHARIFLKDLLEKQGYEVVDVATLAEARSCLQRGIGDVTLLDVSLGDGYGPSLLEETATWPMRPPIVLMTGYGDIEMAVSAMKNGALDFMTKPIQFSRLMNTIERANEIVSMRRELAMYRQNQRQKMDFVVGNNPTMRKIYDYAQRAASVSASVVITGETGTGKEVIANFIHENSPRSKKSIVAINCAAIPSTMLESELFGFEAGAFTSAEKRKPGIMELADGGVLFLDEISAMPLDIQAKLLRALEDRSFRRLGGTNSIRVDLQILAASNKDLQDLIARGLFREDLYYRLKVIGLDLPPLRDRREDIPELVGHFMRKSNATMGKNINNVNPNAMEILMNYYWPGNIRQLHNAIEHAFLFCDGDTIDPSHLPADITNKKTIQIV